MSLREAIKKAKHFDIEEIDIPEWPDPQTGNTKYFIRSMSAGDRNKLVSFQMQNKSTYNTALVALYCLCTDNGSRYFADSELPTLEACSPDVIDRIAIKGLRISKLTAEGQDEAKKS